MSTGANCRIVEKTAGKWYYELQQYPYGETDDYDTEGPFKTYKEAHDHLGKNHANPGGHTTKALPGCPHDLLRESPWKDQHFTHYCDRCGGFIDKRTPEEKAKELHDRNWEDNDIQFPRLLAEIYAAGLSAKQEQDICKSMDINKAELYDLLERADNKFEQIKLSRCR